MTGVSQIVDDDVDLGQVRVDVVVLISGVALFQSITKMRSCPVVRSVSTRLCPFACRRGMSCDRHTAGRSGRRRAGTRSLSGEVAQAHEFESTRSDSGRPLGRRRRIDHVRLRQKLDVCAGIDACLLPRTRLLRSMARTMERSVPDVVCGSDVVSLSFLNDQPVKMDGRTFAFAFRRH